MPPVTRSAKGVKRQRVCLDTVRNSRTKLTTAALRALGARGDEDNDSTATHLDGENNREDNPQDHPEGPFEGPVEDPSDPQLDMSMEDNMASDIVAAIGDWVANITETHLVGENRSEVDPEDTPEDNPEVYPKGLFERPQEEPTCAPADLIIKDNMASDSVTAEGDFAGGDSVNKQVTDGAKMRFVRADTPEDNPGRPFEWSHGGPSRLQDGLLVEDNMDSTSAISEDDWEGGDLDDDPAWDVVNGKNFKNDDLTHRKRHLGHIYAWAYGGPVTHDDGADIDEGRPRKRARLSRDEPEKTTEVKRCIKCKKPEEEYDLVVGEKGMYVDQNDSDVDENGMPKCWGRVAVVLEASNKPLDWRNTLLWAKTDKTVYTRLETIATVDGKPAWPGGGKPAWTGDRPDIPLSLPSHSPGEWDDRIVGLAFRNDAATGHANILGAQTHHGFLTSYDVERFASSAQLTSAGAPAQKHLPPRLIESDPYVQESLFPIVGIDQRHFGRLAHVQAEYSRAAISMMEGHVWMDAKDCYKKNGYVDKFPRLRAAWCEGERCELVAWVYHRSFQEPGQVRSNWPGRYHGMNSSEDILTVVMPKRKGDSREARLQEIRLLNGVRQIVLINDGKEVLVLSGSDDGAYTVDIATGQKSHLTSDGTQPASWWPTGKWAVSPCQRIIAIVARRVEKSAKGWLSERQQETVMFFDAKGAPGKPKRMLSQFDVPTEISPTEQLRHKSIEAMALSEFEPGKRFPYLATIFEHQKEPQVCLWSVDGNLAVLEGEDPKHWPKGDASNTPSVVAISGDAKFIATCEAVQNEVRLWRSNRAVEFLEKSECVKSAAWMELFEEVHDRVRQRHV